MSRLKLMSSGPPSSTALYRLRPRARDGLALRAPAGERRQAAQDKIGVGNRLPADLVEGILHRAGPMRRKQQALDVARRLVARRGLLRKDISRGAKPTALNLPQELWKIDNTRAAHQQEGRSRRDHLELALA